MKYFKKINILVLLVFFYLIFTFSFKNIGTIHRMSVYIICVIYILWNYKYLLKYLQIVFHSVLKYSVIALLICIIATLVLPTIYKTNDYAYLETLFSIGRTMLKLITILILFEKVHKDEATLKLFSQYIVAITCMYIFTTVIFLVFPSLKAIWNNVIDDPDYHIIIENVNYMSRYGIMGYSGFQVAFKVAFAAGIAGYLMIEEKFEINKRNFVLYITYIFLCIGSLFYGRIGMIITLILTAILGILFIKRDKKRIIYLLLTILISIGILVLLYNINKQVRMWMNWALAPFINFIKTGKLYTGSSDIVFNKMIFMPELKTFFFGDGRYQSYYMSTDVGFMRQILFYGIFFTIVAYLSVIIPITKMLITSIKSKQFSITFMNVSFLILLTIEIKGEIFYRLLPLVVIYIILFEVQKERQCKTVEEEANKEIIGVKEDE